MSSPFPRHGSAYAATLLLLVGCDGGASRSRQLDDGGGASGDATTAAGASGSAAMLASSVFADDQVLEVEIQLSDEDWQTLEEHGNEEIYFPASVSIRGGDFAEFSVERIGFRHKGSWTLNHCWDDFGGERSYAAECAKLSYKMKFDEYETDARFEGLKRLNLHASSGDATKLRELLAYDTFNAFGVVAPRAVPARLTINGELQGVFIAVEVIDGRFTAAHFPEGGDGNLYKEMWPRTTISDASMVDSLHANEDTPDVSDMQQFASAVASATEATFLDAMDPWVDLDAMLHYIAVDRALKNWDGIMAFYGFDRPHNYYWYHDDGAEGRFHLIPWDLDNTFWQFDPVTAPEQWVLADPVPDWNVAPGSCEPMSIWEPGSSTRVTPPGCDPFLGLLAKTGWTRFTEIAAELIAGPIRYETLEAKITAFEALLEPLVAEDPLLDVGQWRSETQRFREILRNVASDLEAYVARGYTTQAPQQSLPEPAPEQFTESKLASGLLLDGVNNFEFSDAVAGEALTDSYSYADEAARGNLFWNTTEPLNGGGDFRFEFEYFSNPGDPWNEWSAAVLQTDGSQQVDVSAFTQISMTVVADSARTLRVRIASPAYEEQFNGAWTEFGTELSVGTTPITVKLRIDRFFYPDWAKDGWGAGQGWTTDDSAALAILLRRFSGLLFAPLAHTDAAGELVGDRDPGFIQVDDIYFQ